MAKQSGIAGRLLFAAVVACMLLALAFGFVLLRRQAPQQTDPVAGSILLTGDAGGGWTLAPWFSAGEDCYYFFLPSGVGEFARWSIPAGYALFLGDEMVRDGDALGGYASGAEYTLRLENAAGHILAQERVQFLFSQNIFSMHIETQTGGMDAVHADKDYKEAAEMLLLNEQGRVLYNGGLEHIKGRGNATWAREKRPYNIRLAQSANLLGTGEAQNWTLLANYLDGTYLHNQFAFDMANALDMKYTPDVAFVDLYLNGEYVGLYQLVDRVEISESRVNIENLEAENKELNGGSLKNYYSFNENTPYGGQIKGVYIRSPEDITDGYLLEMEYEVRYPNEPSGFVTAGGQHVVIKSPEYASYEEVEYIAGLVQELEDALNSPGGINPDTGRSYLSIIDLDSWAKKYLVEEVSKNLDGGLTSHFFYKPRGEGSLLYAGPVWDYDIAYGYGFIGMASPDGLYTAHVSQFYSALYAQPEFRERVHTLYSEIVVPYVEAAVGYGIDAYAKRIEAAANMDFLRWPEEGKPAEMLQFGSAEGYIEPFKDFLVQRMRFLSTLWPEEQVYSIVTVEQQVGRTAVFYVTPGEGLELPVLEDTGTRRFTGWLNAETGLLWDGDTTADVHLMEGWEQLPQQISVGGRVKRALKISPVFICALLLVGLVWQDRRKVAKR